MIVSSTEIQNNFGRYLMLAAKEPVTITKNGRVVAQLTSLVDNPEEKNEFMIAETSRHAYGGRDASYEEYLELSNNSDDRYEYIDGEIYYMASPRTTHQKSLTKLFGIFYYFFSDKKCSVMTAPYDITLKRPEQNEKNNIVQPDLVVICDLEDNLDERDYYMGIPELVIEILSDSTRAKDMVKKLDLYKNCGIKEYWIVNPDQQEITVYLFESRDIKEFKTYRVQETASSYLFQNLKVKLAAVFK